MYRKNFSCLRFLITWTLYWDVQIWSVLFCMVAHRVALWSIFWDESDQHQCLCWWISPSTTCQTPYNSSISITFTQFHFIVLYMLSYLGSHHHLNYSHSISCTRKLFYNNIMYFIHSLPHIEPDLHHHYDLHFFYKCFSYHFWELPWLYFFISWCSPWIISTIILLGT